MRRIICSLLVVWTIFWILGSGMPARFFQILFPILLPARDPHRINLFLRRLQLSVAYDSSWCIIQPYRVRIPVAATRDGFVFGPIPQQACRRLRSPHDQLLDQPGRLAPRRWPPDRLSPDRSSPRAIGRNAGGSCNVAGARGARREGGCDA